MSIHTFKLHGSWKGELNGQGAIKCGTFENQISAPADMGGSGVGTNPEDLLLSAFASCQLVTLAAIMQFNKIAFEDIQIKSEADYKMGPQGPELEAIRHFPEIIVNETVYNGQLDAIKAFFAMAEKSCLVSKAVEGNVNVTSNGTVTKSDQVTA